MVQHNFTGTLDSNGFSYKSENGIMKVSKGAMVMMKAHKVDGNIYRLFGNTIVGGVAIVIESKHDDILLRH